MSDPSATPVRTPVPMRTPTALPTQPPTYTPTAKMRPAGVPAANPVTAQQQAAAARGKQLFLTVGCALCHTIDGVSNGNQGPNLTHIATQPYDHLPNDPAFLKRWIKNPQAIKPGILMPDLGLSDAQVNDIVAYLEQPR
ncbi:MAG: c-type cytochrome [Chloroflexi bacterium]|nr:c-type cytochrome [Chloroflexota bacterium]